ncbi:UNVERIFIED_CONTAM: hypothetical protein Cloal_2988 [Acetivibrio alkalicellulosi]
MITKAKSGVTIFLILIHMLLFSSGCQNGTGYEKKTEHNSYISTNDNQSDFFNQLEYEDFSEKDIESANIYVKRIIFQLNEIDTFRNLGAHSDISDDFFSYSSDDVSRYSQILAKIDENKAVYYLIKLKDHFSTQDEIFNEYLVSLQLDIDFDMYINDKDLYHDQKVQKLSEITESSLITINHIEQKAFENLQRLNESNKTIHHIGDQNVNNTHRNMDLNSPQQPNLPHIDIPKPIDPNEELRNKFPSIN